MESDTAPGTISSQIIELHNARDGLGFCVAGVFAVELAAGFAVESVVKSFV